MLLLNLSALFLTTALMGVVGAAQAADVGQCGSTVEIKQLLGKEEQNMIVTATQGLSPDKKALLRISYTKNSAGSVGYITQTKEMLNSEISTTCIYDRMTNVFSYNVRKQGLPADALINVSDSTSEEKCKELIKTGQAPAGRCAALNTVLIKSEREGERVLMRGDAVIKNADGTYQTNGMRITITANIPQSNDPKTYKDPLRDGVSTVLYSSIKTGATILDQVGQFSIYVQPSILKN